MLIKYHGFRARHGDRLYGTGEWTPGTVKDVPDDAGARLLRHPDMFGPGKGGKVDEIVSEEATAAAAKAKEDARVQEARDAVAAMQDKQAVIDFALVNYGRKMNQRQTLDALKRQAVMLIDQYGVQ